MGTGDGPGQMGLMVQLGTSYGPGQMSTSEGPVQMGTGCEHPARMLLPGAWVPTESRREGQVQACNVEGQASTGEVAAQAAHKQGCPLATEANCASCSAAHATPAYTPEGIVVAEVLKLHQHVWLPFTDRPHKLCDE